MTEDINSLKLKVLQLETEAQVQRLKHDAKVREFENMTAMIQVAANIAIMQTRTATMAALNPNFCKPKKKWWQW